MNKHFIKSHRRKNTTHALRLHVGIMQSAEKGMGLDHVHVYLHIKVTLMLGVVRNVF